MADKRYDGILYEYFEKKNGAVVLLSQDPVFKKMLASTIFKAIGTKKDCLWTFEEVPAGLKKIQQCEKSKIDCTVFIERFLGGMPSTDTIIALKRLIPDIKVIVLVGETKSENIAYFYEIGVNNVISKPASINNIIEKMAFTIKPQGKLSEYMHIGKRFLASGKYDEALQVSDKILAIKPDSPAGLMLRGDVYIETDKRPEAIKCYLTAHESSRLYLEPLKRLAHAYEGVDDDEHLKYMKMLDKLSPLNTERKTNIGAIHVKRKEMDKAEQYFDSAIETATKEAMSLVANVAEKINSAVSKVAPEMSEKYLSKVIDAKGRHLGKDDITLFNKLGIALRGQGKWREAITNYERALQISPKDEGLLYNMGMAYYDGKEKRKAAACFDKALKANPDFYSQSEVVCMNMGAIYSDIRELEKAQQFYQTAISINPNNATAKRKLDILDKALNK